MISSHTTIRIRRGACLLPLLAFLSAMPWPPTAPAAASRRSAAVNALNPGCTTVLTGTVSWASGATVPPNETWCFDAGQSTTVSSGGNVIVRGTLRMRPETASVVHTLRFTGAVESEFIGGGMNPVASDDGLWVIEAGTLDISGTPKRAWCRCPNDPSWRPGDELRVAPTALGDYSTFAPFRAGSAVPQVAGRTAEVLNLTRNVNIEGLPTGRAHIFIRSTRPQTIRYASIRHMGPRNSRGFVLGRYALHFHHMGDGSRDSRVAGVVVRETGSHAFVPHASHGITFRSTIAYDVIEDAYWWDPCPGQGECPEATNDTLFFRAVAALVRSVTTDHVLTGFRLEEGLRNTIRESVAVGVQGGANASGFHWPESANQTDANVWGFINNVAHNNLHHGIFVWQNDSNNHVVRRFRSYRNGEAIIDHGAYANSYVYANVSSFEDASLVCRNICSQAALQVHAVSSGSGRDGRLAFRGFDINGGGATAYGVLFPSHAGEPTNAAVLRSFHITDVTENAVHIDENPSGRFGRYNLVCWTVDGRDIRPSDFTISQMHPESVYRVQRADGTAFQVTPVGSVPIRGFASC